MSITATPTEMLSSRRRKPPLAFGHHSLRTRALYRRPGAIADVLDDVDLVELEFVRLPVVAPEPGAQL